MKIIANTKTKTYHRSVCGHAKRKPKLDQIILSCSNPQDIEKLRSYKPCNVCNPCTIEEMLSGSNCSSEV